MYRSGGSKSRRMRAGRWCCCGQEVRGGSGGLGDDLSPLLIIPNDIVGIRFSYERTPGTRDDGCVVEGREVGCGQAPRLPIAKAYHCQEIERFWEETGKTNSRFP